MKAYFKLLAWFVQFANLSPDDFIKLPKDEIVEMVQAFCDKWSDEGKKEYGFERYEGSAELFEG
ncbi:MAG: hypothetical protein QXJ19_07725 [Candidatus Bathyarchaeia archaeon]|nr:hypothetical protein [Candidatus Bathyarchaeota archaeon]